MLKISDFTSYVSKEECDHTLVILNLEIVVYTTTFLIFQALTKLKTNIDDKIKFGI